MRGYMRAWRHRHPAWLGTVKHQWLQAAILSHLAEVESAGARDLLELTGVTDETSLRAAVYKARRAGHPIVSVKTGRSVRYRLAVA